MRRLFLYVFAGVLAFAVAAIALMPASALHALILVPRGVQAGHVSGTVWNGYWHDVQLGPVRLTRLEGGLELLSLLRGGPAFQMSVSDPRGRAEGRLVVRDNRVELLGVSGRIVPARLVTLSGPGRAVLTEPVIFSGIDVRFGPHGCEAASGEARFGGLLAIDSRSTGSLPVLDGTLECAGSLPAIRFAGETDDVAIEGHARFGSGAVNWNIAAQPRSDAMALTLRSVGFDGSGGTLRNAGRTVWDGR